MYNVSQGEKYTIVSLYSVIGADSPEMRDRMLSKIPSDPRKTMQLAGELCIAIRDRSFFMR